MLKSIGLGRCCQCACARRYSTRPSTWALDAARARLDSLPELYTGLELAKQQKELEPLSRAVERYHDVQAAIHDTKQLAQDEEMKDMCMAELDALNTQQSDVLSSIPEILLPPPSTAALPVIMSLNAGVGGTEATMCTQMLARMYQRYAENAGWKCEIVSQTAGGTTKGMDGIKELTMRFSGDNVYGTLRWESGVHRIQRIPPNDAKGRTQTSTVAVIVLPLYPETDTELVNPKDVVTETMRSRGAGGQHVNKTESAIRLTHTPTGISVSMQDSRSQHQNKAWAWEILRARLAAKKNEEEVAAKRQARQQEVNTADRSERIRSYQLNQDRVTDHRVGLTVGNVSGILDGGIEAIVAALDDDFASRRIASILKGEGDLDR